MCSGEPSPLDAVYWRCYVILSVANGSQSEPLGESKDPFNEGAASSPTGITHYVRVPLTVAGSYRSASRVACKLILLPAVKLIARVHVRRPFDSTRTACEPASSWIKDGVLPTNLSST